MRRRSRNWNRTIAVLLGAASLCAMCSADASPQSPDFAHYTGQLFILRGRGSANEIKIRALDVGKAEGICDVAVSVDTAALAKSEIHLVLAPVGIVRYSKGSSTCTRIPSQIRITLTNVPDNSKDEITKVMDGFLLTPEAYVASFGEKFDYQVEGDPDDPLVPLGTPDLKGPKPVLTVDASYTDAARRAHVAGTVVAEITVGRDGRPALGSLVKGLGYGLDEQVLRVLGLWRFAPAQLDGKPVAVRVSMEMSFNIQ
ncbi:MAG TPA: energy transducer TonB [Candidatus Acidoferrales bacterium]|nr:energy transducer TonB [Candidatus Acidoferrales bacterium]